ncbi:MAG: 50S ribosomal protein L18e [Thaumarchaeota archaeon]|nr:50S ribosomal protein L18e [Nitrososphaerota archaeon]
MTKNSSRAPTARSNRVLRTQVIALERKGRKEDLAIWKDVARYLAAPHSTETQVNVGRLSRLSEGPKVVPGKVLGTGAIDKKLVVGAFSYSSSARRKILDAGGEALSIEELVKRYPQGSGVTIVR